ncbi:MAG: ExeM/NucH family extracellular endonuclease, partial [Xanthomonadales bacterium]|nr:ExeM/NucH family extracellular endonuclease [Xanthomonadales bacterium]
DVYRQSQGDLRLSRDSVLPIPTEVARPGPDARRQLAINRRSSIQARLDESAQLALPAGASLLSGSGVLGHDGRGLRLMLRDDLNSLEPRMYRNAPPADGDIRIAAFNLHNYFNGNGRGAGFPTPRGAQTAAEFQQQRSRLSAAIAEIKPQVLAVMELENDGFGPYSAAADFILDTESATNSDWLAVFPGNPENPDEGIGTDAITVGLFYDEAAVELAGRARLLEVEPFGISSRVPLAQAFRDKRSGEVFTVIVNHLKSKGSCPDTGRNSDLRDGQGCWNQARTQAAKALARWARQLADATSRGRVLVVGDMNAYRMEDPIATLVNAGFSDLTAPSGPRPSYTFFYRGEAGTLDYAFATPELMPYVTATRVLNINSPWPPGMELPQPWLRSSDHDPVIVDLGFISN